MEAYMISGAVAAIEYGEPRATLGIDIAIQINTQAVARFPQVFPPTEYYCPPEDVLMIEVNCPVRERFNVIHTTSGLKADFYPSKSHPLFQWAMDQRKRVTMGGHDVWLAPPEYAIIWKLEFYREGGDEKHLRDIHVMLAASGEEIDRELIARTATQLGLDEAWMAVLSRG
jgi:hypothetical protein